MPADRVSSAPSQGKSKKNKKKKGNEKACVNGDIDNEHQEPNQDAAINSNNGTQQVTEGRCEDLMNGLHTNDPDIAKMADDKETQVTEQTERPDTPGNEKHELESTKHLTILQSDTRFEALVRDRDSLRVEVAEMRRTLELIQSKHDEEMETIQNTLRETQNEKHNAETQFRNLLGKVNTIKSQLGERLKADAEELSQARSKIQELESQNEALKIEVEAKSAQIETVEKESEQRSKELSSLRNRMILSQQNWLKEKEELLEKETYLRTEFEEAKQAMHNWEILAMEERSVREGLGEKVVDLEEQLNGLKTNYERASNDNRTQENTIEGLQKALQEIQTGKSRKQELRELVESSDAQTEELRRKLQHAEKSATDAIAELEGTKKELERALPFEKEVKEKNLLIGKLRHEAVTLNEHLTKALRFLKRGRPEDNVDRNLVTNHFLHFLALDRSDPKKFQVLQLIAALLGWTDEQREQAGLARPGSTASLSLRVPGASPVQRTPSSPALASDYFTETTPSRKESLAELWSSFLEQEAQTEKRHKDTGSE
ncbi:hypothetical protein PRK78_001069 [Emydomyces testavorans]|uniref:GRIP domain-containing protein n=1 Tax=Emydomyces testavorans TaxID=2070801 RepID=A0AAF0DBU2_9EURO|nr:hypothetical protein PRK78_001069 [Emydomyces testavorans]